MDKSDDLFRAMENPFASTVRMIIKQANPIDNKWISNKGNHEVIRNKCLIGQTTLEKYLKKMRDRRILIRAKDDGRGVYIINRGMMTYGKE